MNAPLVLIYNLDGKKAGALRVLCLKLNIRVRVVAPEEFAQPVGALAGLTPFLPEAVPTESFREEMLVMVNLGDKMFNALLQGMRAARIRIPLKAVLTPVNAQWSSTMLQAELAREHEALGALPPKNPRQRVIDPLESHLALRAAFGWVEIEDFELLPISGGRKSTKWDVWVW